MNEIVPLLEVKNLKKYFRVPAGINHAVDGVSFVINRGETLGVVGESGCGKSTLGRTLIRLQEATDGQVLLNGREITHAKGHKLKLIRQKMQIIFQDPYSSLNPRKSIDYTVREPLIRSGKYTRKEVNEEAERLMQLVGIDERLRYAYPHELDGGRRQRVGIARALGAASELYRMRRTGIRPGCFHPGAGVEPADGFAGSVRPRLPVRDP